MLKGLYDWVLRWAESPYGGWALLAMAFAESSFFPIPPDVLLIALAISIPARAFKYAAICSAGSILGGLFGYFLGYQFMEMLGFPILEFYHALDKYEVIQQLYRKHDAWAVGIAGFTPIPYKVFTIAAGAFKINLAVFVLASAVSRSARFFIIGLLIYKYGEHVRIFVERYFNVLSILFVILLVLGFVLMRWAF